MHHTGLAHGSAAFLAENQASPATIPESAAPESCVVRRAARRNMGVPPNVTKKDLRAPLQEWLEIPIFVLVLSERSKENRAHEMKGKQGVAKPVDCV